MGERSIISSAVDVRFDRLYSEIENLLITYYCMYFI